ncbi:MAG TPA: peptidase C45 [Planctomycetes bacterium]|nr:peptidase C45 [Planctomycetota bacterium]
MQRLLAFFAIVLLAASAPAAEILGREGKGFLQRIDGLLVLHVRGTPYEMGFQHGKLLADQVRALVATMVHQEGGREIALPGTSLRTTVKDLVRALFEAQRPYYRARFLEELKGLADGAGLPENDICTANHIPELFHCSGFALMGAATADGEVLHGRVLDYGTDQKLQDHALIIIAAPDGRHAFANVSFAGFIGSVTGLNAKGIAVGEMGGGGQLFWAGEPMSFLVRRVLEEAADLDAALEIFRRGPRTCEYYYVVSDGNARRGAGLATTWQDFVVIDPGEFHPRLPEPIKDCVLMSADKRYTELAARVRAGFGSFDAEKAIRLMDAPVAMKSNLHNALMKPKTGDFWAAYAAPGGRAAWNQKYVHLNLKALLAQAAPETAEAARP